MIKKITADDKESLKIPTDVIVMLAKKIRLIYETKLKAYNVKQLWSDDSNLDSGESPDAIVRNMDGKELQIVFLYKYAKCLVHKDAVSAFVRQYIPTAALDQQVRHLGSQLGWYVLNRGNKIPDTDESVPSGYNYLVSIEIPNPKIIALAVKRAGRVSARNFSELKIAYSNKCATCGIEEGKQDPRTGGIVSLQQGHMDPRKPLTLSNTIPQCAYCNQTYLDYFCFNEHGRVISVNNPVILLKSPRDVQDEMIQVLLEERKKTEK